MRIRVTDNRTGGKRVELHFSHRNHDYGFSWGLEEFKELILSLKGGGQENLGSKGPIAVDAMVGVYERLHGHSLRSWDDVEQYRCKQLAKHFGKTPLHKLTPLSVQEYKSHLLASGSSNVKTNRLLAMLKRIFNKAVEWGYVKTNPADRDHQLPEHGRERALSRQEFSKLLAYCDPWLKALVVVAVHTGLRRGDLLKLRWSNVQFDAGRIVVVKPKSFRPRYIPMNSEVTSTLRSIPRHVGTDFVFHQAGFKIASFKKRWKTAVKATGLGDLHFHDLRHTFSTWLSELGFNPMVIMALTGHTSAAMLRKYTNISDPTMARAVEALVDPRRSRLNSDNRRG